MINLNFDLSPSLLQDANSEIGRRANVLFYSHINSMLFGQHYFIFLMKAKAAIILAPLFNEVAL